MLYRPAYGDLLTLREAFVLILTHKSQNCRRVIFPSYHLFFDNTCREMGWIDKDRVREV
jgi:hypothetical protein